MQKKKSKKPKKDPLKDVLISKTAGKKDDAENTNGYEFGGLPMHDLKKNLGCG